MSKELVIQTEELDTAPAAWLAERCEVVRCGPDDKGFDVLLASAKALVVRTYTKVDATMLAKAPKLKVVARAGVGLDNVDLEACRGRGMRVVSTPDANSQAVCEYVWALILDALRPRVFITEALTKARWGEVRKELRAERQVGDLTLGIYGMGRIGQRMARVGAAFGMRVIYNDLLDISPEKRSGAEPVSAAELFQRSDIFTVHVDDRPSNRALVNAGAFGRMRANVVFVNAARGFLIDSAAAAAFFRAHPQAIGLFDVHEPEPFGSDYPLLGIPNVHLAPHIAAATAKAQENMSWVVRDLWRVLNGETPEFAAV